MPMPVIALAAWWRGRWHTQGGEGEEAFYSLRCKFCHFSCVCMCVSAFFFFFFIKTDYRSESQRQPITWAAPACLPAIFLLHSLSLPSHPNQNSMNPSSHCQVAPHGIPQSAPILTIVKLAATSPALEVTTSMAKRQTDQEQEV